MADASPTLEGGEIGERARTAMRHSLDGYLTVSDKAFLAANPQIARGVPDPSLTTSVERTVVSGHGTAKTAAGATVATTCYTTNRYQNYHSSARIKVWEFHTRASWCGYLNGLNLPVVSKAPYNVSSYFEDTNLCWSVDTNSTPGTAVSAKVSSGQWKVVRVGQIHYTCAPISFSVYPKNDVRVFGDGQTSFYPSR